MSATRADSVPATVWLNLRIEGQKIGSLAWCTGVRHAAKMTNEGAFHKRAEDESMGLFGAEK